MIKTKLRFESSLYELPANVTTKNTDKEREMVR